VRGLTRTLLIFSEDTKVKSARVWPRAYIQSRFDSTYSLYTFGNRIDDRKRVGSNLALTFTAGSG
jgi:hypothetical protein